MKIKLHLNAHYLSPCYFRYHDNVWWRYIFMTSIKLMPWCKNIIVPLVAGAYIMPRLYIYLTTRVLTYAQMWPIWLHINLSSTKHKSNLIYITSSSLSTFANVHLTKQTFWTNFLSFSINNFSNKPRHLYWHNLSEHLASALKITKARPRKCSRRYCTLKRSSLTDKHRKRIFGEKNIV
jgi:hypothetical protein